MKALANMPAETALAVNTTEKPEKQLANYIQHKLKGGQVIVDYWIAVMESTAREADRLKASELLASRGWGKPKETLAIELPGDGLDQLDLEDLVAMAAAWRAMTSVEIDIEEGQS